MNNAAGRKRQSKGTPVGGQFAAENRSESEVDLGADTGPRTITVREARKPLLEDSNQIVTFSGVQMTAEEQYWVYSAEKEDTVTAHLERRTKMLSENVDDRVSVAEDHGTPTYYLNKLAKDESDRVRRAVADNEFTSIHALDDLAEDPDEDISEIAQATLRRVHEQEMNGAYEEEDYM